MMRARGESARLSSDFRIESPTHRAGARVQSSQEKVMKKLVMVLIALAMFATVNFGCKAEADVDPHGSSNVVSQR
jgi:hypothetical protein